MSRLDALASVQSNPRNLGLQKLRQKKGISLEQIAEITKISIRFLKAIEAEEFEKLPGGIFDTNYIRQYAMAVGVEQDRLLARYTEKTAVAEDTGPEPRRKLPVADTRSWFDRWLRASASPSRW